MAGGAGTVIVGVVKSGIIRVGMTLCTPALPSVVFTVKSIERHHQPLKVAGKQKIIN